MPGETNMPNRRMLSKFLKGEVNEEDFLKWKEGQKAPKSIKELKEIFKGEPSAHSTEKYGYEPEPDLVDRVVLPTLGNSQESPGNLPVGSISNGTPEKPRIKENLPTRPDLNDLDNAGGNVEEEDDDDDDDGWRPSHSLNEEPSRVRESNLPTVIIDRDALIYNDAVQTIIGKLKKYAEGVYSDVHELPIETLNQPDPIHGMHLLDILEAPEVNYVNRSRVTLKEGDLTRYIYEIFGEENLRKLRKDLIDELELGQKLKRAFGGEIGFNSLWMINVGIGNNKVDVRFEGVLVGSTFNFDYVSIWVK